MTKKPYKKLFKEYFIEEKLKAKTEGTTSEDHKHTHTYKVDKEGNTKDGKWIDDGRLEFSDKQVVKMNEFNDNETGCDIEPPVR